MQGDSQTITDPTLTLHPDTQLVTVDDPSPTISVLWDRAVQRAVIDTAPGPTIASRAYGMVHTAMFDAWAAYDPQAIATQLNDDLQRPQSEIHEDNKIEAMSFAAYRVLSDLFPEQVETFDKLMAELGLDPNNTTTDVTTAAGIGNVSAQALLELRHQDGSNQLSDTPYAPDGGYPYVNEPGHASHIEHWTPEYIPIDAAEHDAPVQEFLTPHWGDVIPFALESGDQFRPVAPQPFLLVEGEVHLEAKTITLKDTGKILPISKDLIGSVINPKFIAQAETIAEVSGDLTDEQKLVAEFWEDAGGTSFPPGTWMTFGEFVSARDEHSLDEDAQMFFALGNAVFDAGIATWEAKSFYDYTRPVRAIRTLGELGLIGEYNEQLGGYAIEAWAGPGKDSQTILAADFMTYQTPDSHASPPFAEYTSGHSAFSAAGAEILASFTQSDDFGAYVTFEPGESRFEPDLTPESAVTLDWSTFSEAADEAGKSRIYGGIHFEEGDFNGRLLGREVGKAVWSEAQFYITGGAEDDMSDAADYDRSARHKPDRFTGDKELILASTENDLLFAGGDDSLSVADGGNNFLTGDDGADVFWVLSGEELPDVGYTIANFEIGVDRLAFGSAIVASVEDLNFSQVEDNTLVSAHEQDLAIVQNTSVSQLEASDNFIFA